MISSTYIDKTRRRHNQGIIVRGCTFSNINVLAKHSEHMVYGSIAFLLYLSTVLLYYMMVIWNSTNYKNMLKNNQHFLSKAVQYWHFS